MSLFSFTQQFIQRLLSAWIERKSAKTQFKRLSFQSLYDSKMLSARIKIIEYSFSGVIEFCLLTDKVVQFIFSISSSIITFQIFLDKLWSSHLTFYLDGILGTYFPLTSPSLKLKLYNWHIKQTSLGLLFFIIYLEIKIRILFLRLPKCDFSVKIFMA